MTSSKKAAYVANGADLDQPFEDNELLNQKDDFPFEDPPWRVLDTEAIFEPMQIGSASAATTESPGTVDTELESDSASEASQDSDPEIGSDVSEAEVGVDTTTELESEPESEALPTAIGFTEEEVTARVAEAVAAKQVELTEKFEPKIKELEDQLCEAQAKVEAVRTEVREATEREFQVQLESSRKTYDGLTKKLARASDNVSEFFEPLSRLAVHVGTELVRGELTVGPTAVARLVQGCLDQLEGYQPKYPPILRMHPEDLAIYLSSINGTPEGVQLRPDESMARGDVSLQMDDTAVEDLIANRLERLANRIFGLGHGFSDEVFRTPLEGEADTKSAFDDINDYIRHEVADVTGFGVSQEIDRGADTPSEEDITPVEVEVEVEAEAEAEAKVEVEEKKLGGLKNESGILGGLQKSWVGRKMF